MLKRPFRIREMASSRAARIQSPACNQPVVVHFEFVLKGHELTRAVIAVN
jgi:hypothetical protein